MTADEPFPPQSTGVPVFQLEFHLPYYAWRRSHPAKSCPAVDVRRLRQSKSLSFLTARESEESSVWRTEYLYEAQITCVVSGTDNWKWLAYCLVDTYFETAATRESVESYHLDAIDGMRSDPLTLSRNDAAKPITAPRDYFMRVLEVRANQVREEWVNVLESLGSRINEYVRLFGSCAPQRCTLAFSFLQLSLAIH